MLACSEDETELGRFSFSSVASVISVPSVTSEEPGLSGLFTLVSAPVASRGVEEEVEEETGAEEVVVVEVEVVEVGFEEFA